MAQKDPVCNMMVDEKNAQHISEANGQKIYLCSAQCKNQFDQKPKQIWILNRCIHNKKYLISHSPY